MDQLRQEIRVRRYSIRTEGSYAGWVRRFIVFHGKRHPGEHGAAEVAWQWIFRMICTQVRDRPILETPAASRVRGRPVARRRCRVPGRGRPR